MNLFEPWPKVDSEKALKVIADSLDEKGNAFTCWAVWSVSYLRYLAALDRAAPGLPTAIPPITLQVIDYSHGHWATVTAITAIDRCAAALGSLLPAKKGGFAYSLSDLNGKHRPLATFPLADRWVASVHADSEYGTVKSFRDPMVHRSIRATAELGGSSRSELRIDSGTGPVSVKADDLVRKSLTLAVRHVGSFLATALEPGFPSGSSS
jgi:hypothetical protein